MECENRDKMNEGSPFGRFPAEQKPPVMYTNPRFAAAARARRTKAFLMTVLFFAVAVAVISYADSGSLIPEFLEQLLNGADASANGEVAGV